MSKIIIASHSRLAEGFKDTLHYIAPNLSDVTAIAAYVDDKSLTDQIEEVLSTFNENDQVIVFTDLLGGSVNQAFIRYLENQNIHLISGMNLPVLLSIALQLNVGEMSAEQIEAAINEAQSQIVYVNKLLSEQQLDEDDE